jgi:DNA-binding CsgD family transcriptional regulator
VCSGRSPVKLDGEAAGKRVTQVHGELDMQAYAYELERHLQRTLFGAQIADPEGVILLIRGALTTGDRSKAAMLVSATRRLAAGKPGDAEMAAAADHARGLLEQDPRILDQAGGRYSAERARARALEDAGNAWADLGRCDEAEARLRQAYELYERLGATDGMARVRSCLRDMGVRVRHWKHASRPAFGWSSLTDTERRIAGLVAQGLSNREVASRVFLSSHTVAFHLRHVFCKLGVSSRVQLARMAAEEAAGKQLGSAQD